MIVTDIVFNVESELLPCFNSLEKDLLFVAHEALVFGSIAIVYCISASQYVNRIVIRGIDACILEKCLCSSEVTGDHAVAGFAEGCTLLGVVNLAVKETGRSGSAESELCSNRISVKCHGERLSDGLSVFIILFKRIGAKVEIEVKYGSFFFDLYVLAVSGCSCSGQAGNVEELFVIVHREDIGIAVGSNNIVIHGNVTTDIDSERSNELILCFSCYFLVEVVVFGTFENDLFGGIATVKFLYTERTIGGKVSCAGAPGIGVRSNLVFTNGNERGAREVVEELLNIRALFKVNSEFVCFYGIETDIVNRQIAALCILCALDAIQHRCRGAVKIGIEDASPSINNVICLNLGSIAPMGVFDRNFQVIFTCLRIFENFIFLCKSFLQIAVFVKLEETFKNQTKNLNSIIIGISNCGVKIHDLGTEINVEFRTLCSRVVFGNLCATSSQYQAHGKREQKSQNFLHFCMFLQIIIF